MDHGRDSRPASGQDRVVFLVGAGPGDPELLTVKAVRLLREADVVVYDRLVSPAILELVQTNARLVYVGKASRERSVSQDEINALLLQLAMANRSVVRLKGGDPFIFGRGSEEAEYLLRHGIRCEIVPGVTAASGCAAEAGIPLTHRGLATGVHFVTGHAQDGDDPDLDWARLADERTTLVVYMGLATAARVSERLIAAGMPGDIAAAAIASATMPPRRICLATLATLPKEMARDNLPPPVLLIIGHVVGLARVLGAECPGPAAAGATAAARPS